MAEPPSISFSSQVHEAGYSVNAELAFLTDGSEQQSQKLLFGDDVSIGPPEPSHVANKEAAALAPRGKPALGTVAGELVPFGREIDAGFEDDETRQAIASLRRFLILQRLFSAALSGQLGEDFPFHKLVWLSRETAPAVEDVVLPEKFGAVQTWSRSNLLSCPSSRQ